LYESEQTNWKKKTRLIYSDGFNILFKLLYTIIPSPERKYENDDDAIELFSFFLFRSKYRKFLFYTKPIKN